MKEEEFYENINELKKLYAKDPKKTSKELKKCLKNINTNEAKEIAKELFNDKNFDVIVFILIIFIIISLGLLNISNFGIYIMGVIFFIAGYLVCVYADASGILFLFTHGITGLAIMTGSMISKVMTNSIMSDNPINIYIYLGIVIAIYVIATIFAIIYILTNRLKEKKIVKFIPLIMYTIGIFLISILPHIYIYLYNIHL